MKLSYFQILPFSCYLLSGYVSVYIAAHFVIFLYWKNKYTAQFHRKIWKINSIFKKIEDCWVLKTKFIFVVTSNMCSIWADFQ